MGNKTLVIVSGPPCTGKAALAEKIAARFSLPLIIKDSIKERLFESLVCIRKFGGLYIESF